ncbi:MAG: signal peptidase II, partial [Clostridia bacterium]|nr:signal peptidase II [Clostridia bacterium]
SMIVGGGIGNMIDRISLGYVVDFLDFRLIHFAVFNVADSFVCVGAGIVIVYLLMDIYKDMKKNKKPTTENTEEHTDEHESSL